jgi:hypothetical protein
LIEACRERLPAKGRWGVLLPLVADENGLYQGLLENNKFEKTIIYYDPCLGAMAGEEMRRLNG